MALLIATQTLFSEHGPTPGFPESRILDKAVSAVNLEQVLQSHLTLGDRTFLQP